MGKFIYTTKLCKTEFEFPNPAFEFDIQKPRYCPICRMPQEGTKTDKKLWELGNGKYYGTVMYTCNSCGKKYLVNYNLDAKARKGEYGGFYPTISSSYENELLAPVSERFVELYNQALRSEESGDIDLAATGYRHALECLVKDYAINELKKDRNEVVKKSLCNAIGEYLDTDLIKAADVVRILGNDYTHYERKYPDLDFSILKNYMEIFIKLIETKVRISHPPVSR